MMQEVQGQIPFEPPQNETAAMPPPAPTQPMRAGERNLTPVWIAVGLAGLILFAVIALLGAALLKARTGGGELPPPGTLVNASAPSPAELSSSFRAIAKNIKPAVVFINVVERVEGRDSLLDILPFNGPRPRGRESRPASGSGIIVTSDGFILTNHHVVGSAETIQVTLSDRSEYKARVVGTDPESDLAVIRIEASGLPFAVLGDSDLVEQGDWVLALGSPFGLQQTLTAGIVSATARELDGPQYAKFIQTDASINPGNSGGPLVNLNGEVIGINSMIFTERQGNVGIGFAISSNIARDVYRSLVERGKVVRGYLGVNVQNLDGARAAALGLKPGSGALVADTAGPESPATKAGLQSGDVITVFDGRAVTTARQLTEVVAATPVGKQVKVDFIRDGKQESVTVEIAERSSNLNAQAPEQPQSDGGGSAESSSVGLSVRAVTPDVAARMNLKIPNGVLVVSVEPGSPAGRAGISHGDVIHQVGKTKVSNVDEFIQAMRALKSGEAAAIQLERGRQMTFVVITPE